MNQFIPAADARKLMENSATVLVDVRSPEEFMAGTAPGAINIPLNVLSVRAHELDAEQHIILFCRSGARSGQAKLMLSNMGYAQAYNAGGLMDMLNCFDSADLT